jgi:FtsP/CotA-like multicopper oxidase with cupredoxin domain
MFALLAMASALNALDTSPDFDSAVHTAPCNVVPQRTKILDPPELRSVNGVLSVSLTLKGDPNPSNITGLCWFYPYKGPHGIVHLTNPPTLHVRQGDRIVVTLINEVLRPPTPTPTPTGGPTPTPTPTGFPTPSPSPSPIPIHASGSRMHDDRMAGMDVHRAQGVGLMCGQPQLAPTPSPDPVTGRIYGYHRSPWNETNLHFHGLNTSPKAPGDDVIDILLCPRKTISDPPATYTYIVSIPRNEPPGTYWYHSHAHGESERQLLSQMTGAIIVDPLYPSEPQKLRNRVIIVRDLGGLGSARPRSQAGDATVRSHSPGLRAIRAEFAMHAMPRPDFHNRYPYGDPQPCPAPTPTGGPHFDTKALLVNGIPLPPQANQVKGLPMATMTYGDTEYWRFANTSSDTILDVELLVNGKLTPLLVASRDGDPLVISDGRPTWRPVPMEHVLMGPGARVEFYLTASIPKSQMVLRTRTIDSGCLGDHAYERNLLYVQVGPAKFTRRAVAAPAAIDPVPARFSNLAQQAPMTHRIFAFTEYNRSDEHEPDWYITELTNPKAVEHPFDMTGPPDVTVKSGTVEDWTILNYTQEVHAFHIHQIHFLVLKAAGIAAGQGQLLDTVMVPYGTFPNGGTHGSQMTPGAVNLRMDFRDRNIIGDFVYHCHILSHEDNGMMAKIRVLPP